MGFDMGVLRIVYVFHQTAFADLLTAVADIWDTRPCGTDFFDEVLTVIVAPRAELAVYRRSPRAFLAA